MFGIDKHTKLLLHMNDMSFKDEMGHPVVNAGGVGLDEIDKKMGEGCSSYTGLTNGYLSIQNASDLNFGLDLDFTIDFWMKYAGTKSGVFTQYPCIFHANPKYSWSTKSICLMVDTIDWVKGVGIVCYDGGGLYAQIPDIANDTWRHIAIVRKNKVLYLFVDGVIKATSTSNFNANFNYNGGPLIGRKGQNANNGQFYGKLDEFRISDVARWVSDFTPPASEYPRDAFLIKQNNQYYSIDPKNYDIITKKFNPVVLAGGLILNKADIEAFGIDSLDILTKQITVGTDTFRPIDILDDNFRVELYKNR